jgi:hypothetical protein
LWPRLKPSFDEFAPCCSRRRSIRSSSPVPTGPLLSKLRLLPSKWLTRSSMSCRRPILVSSWTRKTTVVVTANGMAKHAMTTCPRSRFEPNSWAWSTASCVITSRRSWIHISCSLVISSWWPWYATRSCWCWPYRSCV